MSKGRYYCPYCDTRPGGYVHPWGLRKHIEKIHGDRYEELVVRWEDENRINAFIKNAFIKTAYDTPRGEPAPEYNTSTGKEYLVPEEDAGPGMAPQEETAGGVEWDREAQEAAAEAAPAVTPLKPNPGEFDLAVDMLEIMGTQEAMREALNQAIEQLNVHSQSLSEIMGGTPEKTQLAPVTATGWSFDWKSIPKEWNDPIWKFMGDVGAALRTLAGGAPADDDYGKLIGDELKRREKERMASRAKLIVDTIYGDEELYSKPKDSPKPEDVKKVG
ncbi:MAG TPA: hypothetical protein VMW50_14025 [Dehalococcoidia bacterium]|nr:hypothetical protein [Dehalococcoidia bacterium]